MNSEEDNECNNDIDNNSTTKNGLVTDVHIGNTNSNVLGLTKTISVLPSVRPQVVFPSWVPRLA